jgi:hypothetical protein
MGSHREAVLIVRKANELREKNPLKPALSILDEAMKQGNGAIDLEWESTDPNNPDFVHPDYDSENLPPAPFAEILRQAFAPDLDVSTLVFKDNRENDDFAIGQLATDSLDIWTQRVLMPFGLRYGIEGGKWFPSINIVKKPDNYVEPKLNKEVWVARFAGYRMTWAKQGLNEARAFAESAYLEFCESDPESVAHSTLNDEQLAQYKHYSSPINAGQAS